MKVSPARRAAFEILRRVEEEGAYSSPLLAAADDDLNAKDRALCHELVLGVLRNRLWLDRALEHFAARKVEKLDLAVALALRLGLYQLRFLTRIPAPAALNESVNLVRLSRLKSAASFVNAVLRRATREPDYDPTANVSDELERLAIETSHPPWLIERWCAQFGKKEAAALARANNQPAPLAFRLTAKAAQNKRDMVAEIREAGVELIESKIVSGAWRVQSGSARGSERARTGMNDTRQGGMPALRERSTEGLIYFQDEASQLVAHVLGAHDNDIVLDVCAAPGSKLTLIAALAPNAVIVAGDLYEQRARIIRDIASQQHASNVFVTRHDATLGLPFPPQSFDCVLVDAPCSGTGTLRHKPEIRWRLKEADIAELAARQKQILQNAAAVTRAGGRVVYSTCSVEKDENESIVRDFLENNSDFRLVGLDVPKGLIIEYGARTWPHRDDVDGFFLGAFQRTA